LGELGTGHPEEPGGATRADLMGGSLDGFAEDTHLKGRVPERGRQAGRRLERFELRFAQGSVGFGVEEEE
jgi:hypothetical protein